MLTILLLIIILGVLVLVHEMGHYLVAIRNGVKAEEFGFGFPPRIVGWFKDKNGKWNIVWGNKEVKSDSTIFSLNLIPLGGFVKIKGEDGEDKNSFDSFASQSAWIKIKILAAGVIMNFLLAWFLMTLVAILGVPQPVSDDYSDASAKVQIVQVLPNSPAKQADLQPGDEIVALIINGKEIKITKVKEVQKEIIDNKGKEIILKIKRGQKVLKKKVRPRLQSPSEEGALGIVLVKTALIKYPWYQALYRGWQNTWEAAKLIFSFLFILIYKLFHGDSVANQVAGPVGIAYMTKQASAMGLTYLLQFMALLSVNLAIINILPFPALDGGRILFILLEKIKGNPVSKKVETWMHNLGFILLILLMIIITFNDLIRYHLVDKIKHLF